MLKACHKIYGSLNPRCRAMEFILLEPGDLLDCFGIPECRCCPVEPQPPITARTLHMKYLTPLAGQKVDLHCHGSWITCIAVCVIWPYEARSNTDTFAERHDVAQHRSPDVGCMRH